MTTRSTTRLLEASLVRSGNAVATNLRSSEAGGESPAGPRHGSYGLRLVGEGQAERALAEAGHWMLPADPAWPRWRVEWNELSTTGEEPLETRSANDRREELGADRARLTAAAAGGWIELDRLAQRTRFSMPEPVTAAALVHPYLTSTAAIAAHWLGRTPFHAGGFLVAGTVWGVLGGREMGKSSLLMGLHTAGIPVISDDLIVLDHDRVYSGPRCLDLRRGAAERFAAGRQLGRVGRRERWRVDLGPVPPDAPLGGWVVLGWSERTVIEPFGAGRRLAALAMNRAVTARGAAPTGLLDAAALPVVLFSRPRDWSKMEGGIEQLLDALSVA